MMAAAKACNCGGRIRNGRCDRCQVKRPTRVYNTMRWRRLSLQVRKEEPTCRRCQQGGLIRPSEHVDHIQPVRRRPELAFVRSNLQALCASCHSAKQAEE